MKGVPWDLSGYAYHWHELSQGSNVPLERFALLLLNKAFSLGECYAFHHDWQWAETPYLVNMSYLHESTTNKPSRAQSLDLLWFMFCEDISGCLPSLPHKKNEDPRQVSLNVSQVSMWHWEDKPGTLGYLLFRTVLRSGEGFLCPNWEMSITFYGWNGGVDPEADL